MDESEIAAQEFVGNHLLPNKRLIELPFFRKPPFWLMLLVHDQ